MDGIRKYSAISLILIDLLDNNYICVKKCIDVLKDVEINDARTYYLERLKLQPNIFSTYSFLYGIKGIINLQGKKMRKNRKIIYREPKVLTVDQIIEKYDYILNSRNLSDEQREKIIEMKNNRLNRLS
jgi:hypothetical protein